MKQGPKSIKEDARWNSRVMFGRLIDQGPIPRNTFHPHLQNFKFLSTNNATPSLSNPWPLVWNMSIQEKWHPSLIIEEVTSLFAVNYNWEKKMKDFSLFLKKVFHYSCKKFFTNPVKSFSLFLSKETEGSLQKHFWTLFVLFGYLFSVMMAFLLKSQPKWSRTSFDLEEILCEIKRNCLIWGPYSKILYTIPGLRSCTDHWGKKPFLSDQRENLTS